VTNKEGDSMVTFSRKILVIGFGSVAQCTLPILFKLINIPYDNVTVIDFEDRRALLQPWIDQGVHYDRVKIEQHTMDKILSKYVSAGDMILDLAWNIGAEDIIQWSHDHDVMYLNTSVELWDPYSLVHQKHPTEKTLYYRHMRLRNMVKSWKKTGPTIVLEHGANPGLISHLVKQGLLDIANKLIKDKKTNPSQTTVLKTLMKDQAWAKLAQALEVKVIHVSERDTQISAKPKQVDEFVNTWSVEGFREEGTTTSELGWGTHEKTLPALAYQHKDGPKNQICLARMGMNTWVSTFVPHYEIRGMVVRHGEAFTLSDYLTVYQGKKPVYRPTVHYAYCPSDAAIASLNELRGNNYRLQNKIRIMNDDIIHGEDILGALIMGHAYQSWWIGSKLSIQESRALVPHQNATTMQVAISIVSAVHWMIENPTQGYCQPEHLPHEYILKLAKPYLGQFISQPFDWNPLKNYHNEFAGFNKPQIDKTDVWQFTNFLITDHD
jgi:homospermidine synthase